MNPKGVKLAQKQNHQFFPTIAKNHSLDVRKQKYYVKPKLSRILYMPVTNPDKKMYKQLNILESVTHKKSYEEILDDLKQREIDRYLHETKIRFNERETTNLQRNISLGKQVVLKYYDNYKKLDKLVGRKKLNQQNINFSKISPRDDQDPPIQALRKAEDLGLLPCCMGLIKGMGDASILNINGHRFGDKYVQAISIGLKESKLVENCQFSNNRLSNKGFSQLLNSINNQISKLDVSKNNIIKMDQKLLNLLIEPDARLEYLNLQGNTIPDIEAINLFRSCSYSRHLKYLNLRKNLLTGKCADEISDLILKTTSLEELYIGTNRIFDGAIKIINALEKNKTIKIFDFSMNKLGEAENSCAKNIANLLLNNKTLIHVDFSDNNFNIEQSTIIAEALEKNKKIYGFHFAGNYGYIDSKGFLKLAQKEATTLHSIVPQNISSYDIVFPRKNTSFEAKKFKNVCWICEGWYEQGFKFNVPEESPDGNNLVYIHFDFEEYEPRLINLTDMHVKYKTMVPPGKYKYFYTWNKMQFVDGHTSYTEKKLPSKKLLNPKKQNQKSSHQPKVVDLQIGTEYEYEMYHQMIKFTVKSAIMRMGKAKRIVDSWDQLVVSVLPRQIGMSTKKQKIPWTFKDSLWAKEWKLDDDDLMRNCFERDWKMSKLMNFIKNQSEQDKVKEILHKNYKLIKEIYKYYASWNPFNGDIWAVSNNAFTEFCHEAKIISKDTPLKITDLTFITTNSMSGADWKGNNLVPERGLIRFQFMESIVRLAEQKFKKNGHCDSILASVTSIMKQNILPLQDNPAFCSQKWRLKKYFIEQNDMLVKKYRPIFTDLYKKNSRMKVKPGNKPFMCLAEFKSIFDKIGLAGTLILERDIFISSNCAMMSQVDEIQNQRFIRMTQIQFIEGVARCAFILPDKCKVEDIFQGSTPFYAKFQWIIHEIKALCPEDIQNQFPTLPSLFNVDEDQN